MHSEPSYNHCVDATYLGVVAHIQESRNGHMYRCAQVSTDRLHMVSFMPWGYIKDIPLHVLKPFDPQEPLTLDKKF